jgi:hypothetical protein
MIDFYQKQSRFKRWLLKFREDSEHKKYIEFINQLPQEYLQKNIKEYCKRLMKEIKKSRFDSDEYNICQSELIHSLEAWQDLKLTNQKIKIQENQKKSYHPEKT